MEWIATRGDRVVSSSTECLMRCDFAYDDRIQAGAVLAARLTSHAAANATILAASPTSWKVAYEIGRRLGCEPRLLTLFLMPPGICGREVIVVDDGLTEPRDLCRMARMIREQNPRHLRLALPISESRKLDELRDDFDSIVCGYPGAMFLSRQQWYRDGSQAARATTDRKVASLLPQ